MQEKLDELKISNEPQPIRSDGAGALDLAPRNSERAKQLPDTLVPPATDFGLIPNLKFSFADAHMTLKPGGMREIHWHSNADEYPGFEMPSANRTPQNVKYFKNFDYKVKNPPCNAAKEH